MDNPSARQTLWVTVAGRKIKIYDEAKTQSVNICTVSNTEGDYEQVFYFCGPFRVTDADISPFQNLGELTQWLRTRSYNQLQ